MQEHKCCGDPAICRYLAGVGLYSYSLYLLHRPIQLAVEPLARRIAGWPVVIGHDIPSSLLIMLSTIPIVLWASRLFYRVCEGPCTLRAQRVGRGGRPEDLRRVVPVSDGNPLQSRA